MTELAARYGVLDRQLRRGAIEHLAHGTRLIGTAFGKPNRLSTAPESIDHRWQRIVDALPDSPEARAWQLRRVRRCIVRYGCRRLRAGHQWHWQRPLAVVRAETAATLRQLGHTGLARVFEPAGQLELGL